MIWGCSGNIGASVFIKLQQKNDTVVSEKKNMDSPTRSLASSWKGIVSELPLYPKHYMRYPPPTKKTTITSGTAPYSMVDCVTKFARSQNSVVPCYRKHIHSLPELCRYWESGASLKDGSEERNKSEPFVMIARLHQVGYSPGWPHSALSLTKLYSGFFLTTGP